MRSIAIILAGLSLAITGCGSSTKTVLHEPLQDQVVSKNQLKIEQFCGNCHPFPSPSSFPKSNWPAEVERGFGFYTQSGRTDLEEPLVHETVQYFQRLAPEKLVVPSAETFAVFPSTVRFLPSPLMVSGDKVSLTADMKWDSTEQLLYFSDMANSKLRRWSMNEDQNFSDRSANEIITLRPENVLAEGNHLCRMTECDWNRDGLKDFMVAEIGSMLISDQKLGTVSVYLQQPNGKMERIVLASGLARPVEAVPWDYDEDGDLDVVIAEFGYNTEGCLSLLRNQLAGSSISRNESDFKHEVIDSRHGQLAVVLADMNGDSKLDIVTAIGQEYESVIIRYNEGGGKYRSELVMALPDPSYNTSSIQVCDLNGDGKLDILHTSGDIFDSFVPKKFHGVRWIQNLGEGRWETRDLGMLIGSMQTTTADFDQDGDLDIAAVGLFPASATFSPDISYDSVVWWEQQADLKFVRHSIERDHCLHSSCTSADIDGDGRVDLVVGEWAEGDVAASFRVFWNRATVGNPVDSHR